MAIDTSILPDEAQYTALGHLHRPQKLEDGERKIYYSGSPLQYSRDEINYSKCIYLINIDSDCTEVEEIYLDNYKPIEVWRCSDIDEALARCEDIDRELWLYLEIETSQGLTQTDIRDLKSLHQDILQIRPIFPEDREKIEEMEDYRDLSVDQLFEKYYREEKGSEPSDELMELFYNILNEAGDINETD